MKIINATWEKRNLFCNTLEITLDNDDNEKSLSSLKAEIDDAIKSNESAYVVLKFDSKCNSLLHLPALCGFNFAESQIVFNGNIQAASNIAKNVLKNNRLFSFDNSSTTEDFNFVADEISKGIFKTDRIALDSNFGVEIANKRYINWLLDLKESGNSLLTILKMKDTPIGYELAKFEKDIVTAIHGGLFVDSQKKPVGLMEMASLVVSYNSKFSTHIVDVSSNNLPVIKGWQYFGYQIADIKYVFTKHINKYN